MLHNLIATDGQLPSGLTQASDGNFYGTMEHGGTHNGTIYRLKTNGIYTVLYNFIGGADGSFPVAGPTPAGWQSVRHSLNRRQH